MNEINLTQPTISDKSGDSDTIQSMGDDAHIEIEHLKQKCERQKAEMVVMQVQIDSLTANW